MDRTEICDLCLKYGTDKGPRDMGGIGGWGYSPHYYRELLPMKHTARKVLEIGICGERPLPNNVTGASLFVWNDFFPTADIYGIDNDPRWIVNTGRIRSLLADAYDPALLHDAMTALEIGLGDLDFIVDDAVHDPMPQVQLFEMLSPYLAPGGLFAIEEVCLEKLPNGDIHTFVSSLPDGFVARAVPTHLPINLLLLRRGFPNSPTRLIVD